MGIYMVSPWNRKAKRWLEGRKGIFDRMREELSAAGGANTAAESPVRETIWMHCSSLGEFEQGRPVLERLRALYPDQRIIISFFSPSGYEARKDYGGADHVF